MPALLAVPRGERGSVAPSTALAAFVVLATRANFRTGEVTVDPSALATALDVTPRSARRTLALLQRVGALRADASRWWISDLQVRAADLQVPNADLQVRPVNDVPAGHGADSGHPLRAEFLSEQPEGFAGERLRLVALDPGQMQLAIEDATSNDVREWLRDKHARLRKPLSAVRATTDQHGPGARLPHARGEGASAGGDRADGTAADATAEAGTGAR